MAKLNSSSPVPYFTGLFKSKDSVLGVIVHKHPKVFFGALVVYGAQFWSHE